MSYQTGVTSTVADLISTLRTFAVSNGFTNGASWTDGIYSLGSISKGGVHYVFTWTADELYLNTALSVSGSGAAIAQSGACEVDCRIRPIQGPHVGYHFFSDGNTIHVVVELVTNVFQHFSFGAMAKSGSWVGGAYVTGNNWSPTLDYLGKLPTWQDYRHVHMFESISNSWTGVQQGHVRATYAGHTIAVLGQYASAPDASVANGSPWWIGMELLRDSPNEFNTRAALVPVEIYLSSEFQVINPVHWLQLGCVPTAASVNVQNLNPRETVNTDWMVFPLCQKNGPGTSYVNSENIGMAYRK